MDAIHMDDYFYPYPAKGVDFDDASFLPVTAGGIYQQRLAPKQREHTDPEDS